MGMGAAIAASAGVGLLGSVISAGAAGSAADTQASAANAASERALQQYQQTRSDLAPFRAGGLQALDLINRFYGAPLTGAPQSINPIAAPPAAAPPAMAAPPSFTGAGLPSGWAILPQTPDGTNMQLVNTATNTAISGGVDGAGNLTDAGRLAIGVAQGVAASGNPLSSPPSTVASTPVTTPGNPLSAYGLSGLTFQPTQAQLEATPGYQFNLSQGLRGVENSASAQGRGISGPALRGAASYATGLASNTLGQQQGIFQQNLGNVLNPLMWEANLGQNAAATTGQQGVQAVGNANALSVGGANAQAAGTIGTANAISGGLGSLGNAPLNYMLYSKLLGGGGGGYVDNTSTF